MQIRTRLDFAHQKNNWPVQLSASCRGGYRVQLDLSIDKFMGDKSAAVALEHTGLDADLA